MTWIALRAPCHDPRQVNGQPPLTKLLKLRIESCHTKHGHSQSSFLQYQSLDLAFRKCLNVTYPCRQLALPLAATTLLSKLSYHRSELCTFIHHTSPDPVSSTHLPSSSFFHFEHSSIARIWPSRPGTSCNFSPSTSPSLKTIQISHRKIITIRNPCLLLCPQSCPGRHGDIRIYILWTY